MIKITQLWYVIYTLLVIELYYVMCIDFQQYLYSFNLYMNTDILFQPTMLVDEFTYTIGVT